ncbi:SpoIIE family protein phosphatase [Terriglobus sp. 2YAB30_2]|uniref:PP2C family protein-serine/threonine phosphatase n=2 Tax=unclassified Terriglobus TaxID=2628988 RepID=UPI003F9DB900
MHTFSPSRPRYRPAVVQYLLLLLIAAMALGQWGNTAYRMVRGIFGAERGIRAPFSLSNGVVEGMSPFLRHTGLQVGDRLLAVNGHELTGEAVLLRELAHEHLGDTIKVEVQHPDGKHQTVSWQLITPQRRRGGGRPAGWIGPLLLLVILPLAFLLVGLWVVLAKPHDLSAWLVLGILPYFEALLSPANPQGDWTIWFAPFWNETAQMAMPICLMWFGVLFPERAGLDRRAPWIKWLLSISLLALLPFNLLHSYARLWNLSLDRAMSPWFLPIDRIERFLSILCVAYFFVLFSHKIFREKVGADSGRRLRLLFWGSLIGLTPFGGMVIYTLLTGEDVSETFPQWLSFGIVLVLAIFPLSLAYAMVVQRAMDIRLIVRQGTRYAFARYTLFGIRALLGVLFSWRLTIFFADPESHRRPVDVVLIFVLLVLFFGFRMVLSGRLQQEIDRRFFREAYSTEQVLSELSEQAHNFTETGPLLSTITQRISDTLHIERMAVFLRGSGDVFRLQTATGVDLTSPVLLPAHSATVNTLSREKRPAAMRIDDSSHWLLEASDTERAALSEFQTELLVPLPGRGRLIGVMALGPKRSEEPYSRMDRRLLESVASQTGLALENAELLQSLAHEAAQRERVTRDIEIAREVQERLFPQSYPEFEGVDVAGYCRPAQEIGGDYYDVMEVKRASDDGPPQPRLLGLAIGDVSGKGISAALLMASLRASLRGLTLVGSSDLGELMGHVNKLVYDGSTANRYATFFYAEYDPATRRLCYANGGHNPPVILRGDQVLELEVTGMVVGITEDAAYEQRDIYLEPGDILLLFTDGISEAMDGDDEEWGERRMVAATQQERARGALTAEGLLRALYRRADEFVNGAPQHDDMTLVVMRVN